VLGDWLWIAYDMGSATPLPDNRERLVLPTATCLRLLSDVARALDHAAAEGVFPCELPPESVFVSRRGARLGDLGTAREVLGRARPGGDTAYVPPEILRGEPAGDRSGVYVFGALLYHLFAGASPRGAHGVPLASWRPDLPASMNPIVAATMADEPERRPRSAGEAHELVKRAIRNAAAAPGSAVRPRVTPPHARSSPRKPTAGRGKNELPAPLRNFPWGEVAQYLAEPPEPAAGERAAPVPRSVVENPAATKRSAAKPPASKSPRASRKPAAKPAEPSRRPVAKPAEPPRRPAAEPSRRPAAEPSRSPAAKLAEPSTSPPRGRSATSGLGPLRRFSAVVVAGSALLGSAVGLLLGQSPAADPVRAKAVQADGMGVTVPPGWRAADGKRSGALTVRQEAASGSSLQVRLVHAPPVRPPGSQPVKLGALQAWRAASPGVVRYAAPATEGTVLITCRAPTAAGADALRQCERTASTLTLDEASAVPLAETLEEEDRLQGIIADLRARRDAGRRRLARAAEPSGQSVTAQNLVRSHERAAVALDRLSGAEPIAAAVRRTAAAYSSLATSAESRSTPRWERARERLRRLDHTLGEVLAARG
jgi:hypothetical protein